MGTEDKVDLKALVNAVKTACNWTHHPELTDEEVEKLFPFLGWCPAQVVKKTLENTIHLAKLENRLPMM